MATQNYRNIIAEDFDVDDWAQDQYGDNARRQETYDTYMNTTEPPRLQSLFGNLDELTDYLIPIGIFLAVLMVIVGGYLWMASAGNPEKVKQAQGTLTWAIIGLVFIAIAVLLVNLVIQSISNL